MRTLLQLMPLIAIALILAVLINTIWQLYQARQRKTWRENLARARAILEAGGPQNRQDYFAIFPDACPRCGSRSRYDHPRIKKIWVCSRCQYGKDRCQPQGKMHSVSSPYISSEIADALPELTFSGPGHRQIFVQNDDVTPMEVVVNILTAVFELPQSVAICTMFETHSQGRSYVITLPTEAVEAKLQMAKAMAQDRGSPLTFTAVSDREELL